MRAAATAVLALGLLWQGPAQAQTAAPLRIVSAGAALELRSGERKIADIKPTTPPDKRGEPRLTEVTVEGRKLVQVTTPLKEAGAAEVWVGALTAAGTSPVWTGRIGPVDSDGEVAQHLDLQNGGVLLYQTAARIAGCDGQPVRLLARRFDFASRRWKPVAAPLPPADRRPSWPVAGAPACRRGGRGWRSRSPAARRCPRAPPSRPR